MKEMFTAVVVAGGRGERFGAKKQFQKISGIPIVVMSARKVFNHRSIAQKIIVVPEEDIDTIAKTMVPEHFHRKDIQILPGGETRQESVYNALSVAIEDYVIVHDGVRPLVSEDVVDRCINLAVGKGGAVVCCPVSDTVKLAEGGRIISTIDRDRVYLSQTPQAFRTDILKRTFELAREKNFLATDESMLVEYAIKSGVIKQDEVEIAIVEGDSRNIKITHQEDIALAEFYLRNKS
ncbi:MAG TPA: 2-C-methyl-D-erythritol 4-phosphate cytidylyltransferase [Firmicutes bacterium]|nr:2-C-methyl-D-erythritol 4-phosphate cytidylyltransferase [Bacillota bacterium]